MNITRVTLSDVKNASDSGQDKNCCCAVATVVVDDSICIHGIQIMRGKVGMYITFPHNGAKKVVDGKMKYMDVVHPTCNNVRQQFTDVILEEYRRLANS